MINTTTIEDACDLVTDGTHYTPKNAGQGIPFLTVKDVSDVALDFDGCSFISTDDYEAARAGNSAPQRGDILFSEDGYVSGLHCRVARGSDGRVYITDVGSSNGSFVRLRGERSLGSGDILLMGQQLFRVDF